MERIVMGFRGNGICGECGAEGDICWWDGEINMRMEIIVKGL